MSEALRWPKRFVYSDPWQKKFHERYRMLQVRGQRVAYFYEQADNSTFRYRVYNPCQTLNSESSDWSASYFFLSDLHDFERIIDAADVVVACRVRYSLEFVHLVSLVRARGKKIVFDVDDLVFDVDLAHFIANNNGYDLKNPQLVDTWFSYIARLNLAMRMCDGVIVTNDYLAQQVKRCCDLPVRVMRNYMNREQLEYSEQLVAVKKSVKKDDFFRIGYFSGSPSHVHDFAVVTSALESLLKQHSNLKIVLVGYIASMATAPAFAGRVETVAFQDFVNLQRVIASVDLNLAPLQNNVFTNCKSELKYFEASAVETVSVATPTHTFKNSIVHGCDGYLADDCDWYDLLEQILHKNADDLQSIARSARQKCIFDYGWNFLTQEVVDSVSW